ncbi:MAG: alpha/beta hydrolase [Pseudomonadota bacterium]
MPFRTVRGHRLEVAHIPGDADRPALVFLHEGLGSTALWKDFPASVAAATRCPTIVYSRYGYGKSDPIAGPRAVRYMHDEALHALPELLDELQVENPILIGHSDGASIALIHAGAGERSVRGLILEAPHVFVEDLTVDSIAKAKITYETTDLGAKLGRYHDDPDNTFWGWNDIWLHPDFRAWNIEEVLPSITCPSLVIQGADDEYGTLAQVETIAAQSGGPVDTLVLPDCRHSPHRDQEAATRHAMVRFIEEL